MTEDTSEDGQPRVYFTQQNSVVTYFDEDGDGHVCAHAELSEFACPWTTTSEKLAAVKMAMLEETARPLHCRADQVELMTLADIRGVADPLLKVKHSWAGRSKGRSRSGR